MEHKGEAAGWAHTSRSPLVLLHTAGSATRVRLASLASPARPKTVATARSTRQRHTHASW
jgi:hypothetical protein